MNCPDCQHKYSRVLETRPSDGSIRRRRLCMRCEERFTTYEVVDGNEKKSEGVELMLKSLVDWLEKCPITTDAKLSKQIQILKRRNNGIL